MNVKKILVFLILFSLYNLTLIMNRQQRIDAETEAVNPTGAVLSLSMLEVKMVTITFDSNGGSLISSVTLSAGSPFIAPDSPTKAGYAFGGWFLDDGTFLNQYQFLIVPNENLTLHAKWLDLAAVTNVDLLILEIPEIITISHTILIETARMAYDALSVEVKPFVTQYGTLLLAEELLDELQDQITKVIRMIDNLTCPISYVDRDIVFEARDAYDALAPDQKEKVMNYVSLWDAERRIIALEAEAQAVVDLINDLPSVVSLVDSTIISEARSAYDALTVCQQSYVQNYYVLAEVEDQIALLRDVVEITELVELIDQLPEVTTIEDFDAVMYAASLYRLMYPWQKSQITNYDKLEAAEATTEAIIQAGAFMTLVAALPDVIGLDHQTQIESLDNLYQTFGESVLGFVEADSIVIFEASKTKINDLLMAQAVINQIAAISESNDAGKIESIRASRNAYDSLTEIQKSYVANLADLLAAETVIPVSTPFRWEWIGLISVFPLSILIYVFRFKILKLFKK